VVVKVNKKFQCIICKELYPIEGEALSCEQSHDIIYVPLDREDLYKLIQFIYSGDISLISDRLKTRLLKYRKGNYK